MRTVSLEAAASLLRFAATPAIERMGFADAQLEGSVAAHNLLARNRVAYLADEVGMGKTYVALGAMALLRHFRPDARIMVIAPRENLQRKWVKELGNFVQQNWRVSDNRVRSLQGTPARPVVVCDSLLDLVREVAISPDRDLYLRMTSFSLWTNEAKHRRQGREALRSLVPWLTDEHLPTRDAHDYRVGYGRVLNALLPDIDLLVVDEGHNLKHGSDPRGSTRNVLLASMVGHPAFQGGDLPRSGPRVGRLLVLSATPFEHDYTDLWRQLDLFGLGRIDLVGPDGEDPLSVQTLADPEIPEERKATIVRRFLLRRVSGLRIGGLHHTKNMYRREWRQGGFACHDEPMRIEDTRQRLVVALVQRKVSEILGHERFNNHFQIGMLSSFESFRETAGVAARNGEEQHHDQENGDGEESPAAFDGRQTEDRREQEGIDTDALRGLVRSYRERFGESLPHPKVDAAVDDLASAFTTGEKALVFVRRLATMAEIKARLDERYNTLLRQRMGEALPGLEGEVDALFDRFDSERRRYEAEGRGAREEEVEGEGRLAVPRDLGGRDSFFAWFFRGEGPSGVLSGAAFQRNRLNAASSAYSVFFEDDLVAWLLGRPGDVLGALAERVGGRPEDVGQELRARAYAVFLHLTGQKEGYPRLYAFEAYQAAAMEILRRAGGVLGDQAGFVLHARFDGLAPHTQEPPEAFPGPAVSLGAKTFLTTLAARPDLHDALLPALPSADFGARFLDRERRRELLRALCRLGAAYVDLYLLAVQGIGSFDLGQAAESARAAEQLADAFVARLAEQEVQPGFHAYRELREAASAFDVLLDLNFPEVRAARLSDVPRLYARVLTAQAPVATPRRGALRRLISQFRMPGYPLVLVTTDILQEGEDLHTFCRKVVHYGISWTPSAMEQRTGRVDRIHSLVQRRLDGSAGPAPVEELIQVHYPHLQDTVEVLQVRRVLSRMNRFLRLLHKDLAAPKDRASTIDTAREVLAGYDDIEPIREPLVSAFPVDAAWLLGEVGPGEIRRLDEDALAGHLESVWGELARRLGVEAVLTGERWNRAGEIMLEGERVQPFDLELRSRAVGDATLLRCVSPVGALDLSDAAVSERMREIQTELGLVKVCARPGARRRSWTVSLEGDLPFDPRLTQAFEVESLVLRTTRAAQRVASALVIEPARLAPVRARAHDLARVQEWSSALASREDLGVRIEVEEEGLRAHLGANGRVQRVRIEVRGPLCVLTSVVLTGEGVHALPDSWEAFMERVWEMNAQTDLVTFALDHDDALVGRIEHPLGALDEEEFETYVLTLLRECDRLEYSLTGEDCG